MNRPDPVREAAINLECALVLSVEYADLVLPETVQLALAELVDALKATEEKPA